MTESQSRPEMGRRGFVVRAITAIQTLIGATLAFVAGATTLAPSFERRQSSWLRAAHVDAVPDDQPLAVTLRIARQDGFTQVVDRKWCTWSDLAARFVRSVRRAPTLDAAQVMTAGRGAFSVRATVASTTCSLVSIVVWASVAALARLIMLLPANTFEFLVG